MKATLFCSLLFLFCELRQSDKLNVCIRASPRGSSHFNSIDDLPDDETKTYGDSAIHAGWESSILRMKPLHRLGDYPAFLDVRVQPPYLAHTRTNTSPIHAQLLIRISSPSDYPHHNELRSALAVTNGITDRINEVPRTTRTASAPTTDLPWPDDVGGLTDIRIVMEFGHLLLSDVFVVTGSSKTTKTVITRELRVSLFEKIIASYEERLPAVEDELRPEDASQESTTYLYEPDARRQLMKGCIWLEDVITMARVPDSACAPWSPFSCANRPDYSLLAVPGDYNLQVWWGNEVQGGFFILRCRSNGQLRLWENEIIVRTKLSTIRNDIALA